MFAGGWELIVVALIVLLLFGSRIPSTMRSLGSGISQFKKGLKEGEEDANSEANLENK